MAADILLMDGIRFYLQKYACEKDLEKNIIEHHKDIFGEDSLYFDKQTIETQARLRARTDGFVISLDLKEWYVLEVELAKHDVSNHIVPQITKFSIAYENPETRKKLVKAFENDINKNPKKRLMFELKGIKEVYKFLSNIIDSEPVIVIPIDEKRSSDIERICKKLRFATKIIEFKTFTRENAPTIHAHLFEPLFEALSIRKKPGESETTIKEGDVVKLKGVRPPKLSEWSWSKVWGQERRVKEVKKDWGLLIRDDGTRGFWFPLKCLERVEVTSSEKEIQKPAAVSEWTDEELIKFLEQRSDIQRTFLKILSENNKVYNDDLVAELKGLLGNKFDGYTSGALGGLNNAINQRRKKHIHYREWDKRGKFYKIEDKYRDLIKRYFSQQ